MTASATESVVGESARVWSEVDGQQPAYGPGIAPDMPAAERADLGDVILARRLGQALTPLRYRNRPPGRNRVYTLYTCPDCRRGWYTLRSKEPHPPDTP